MPTHTLMKGSRKLSVYQKAFDFILGRIQHDCQCDTVTEDPIPPAFRLAACLYCLAGKDQSETFPSLCPTPNSTGGRARELAGKAAIFVINRLNSHVQWKSFFLETTRGDQRDNNSRENTFRNLCIQLDMAKARRVNQYRGRVVEHDRPCRS